MRQKTRGLRKLLGVFMLMLFAGVMAPIEGSASPAPQTTESDWPMLGLPRGAAPEMWNIERPEVVATQGPVKKVGRLW